MVALSGQSPLAYLYERDSFKRNVMQKVGERYTELQRDLNQDLANKIIQALASATKR